MVTFGHTAPNSPSRATQNLTRVSCFRKRASDGIRHSSAWHNGRALLGDSTLHLLFFSSAGFLLHLDVTSLSYYLFGYLKKNPNRRIVLDSRPLLIDEELQKDSFHPDF